MDRQIHILHYQEFELCAVLRQFTISVTSLDPAPSGGDSETQLIRPQQGSKEICR